MPRFLPRRSDASTMLVPAGRSVLATALVAVAWLVASVGTATAAAAQASGPTRIVAVGDSITLGLRDTDVRCSQPSTYRSYPRRLVPRLASNGRAATIEYSANCGDTVAGVLARLDGILATRPDVVVVKIGTNDFSAGMGYESLLDSLVEIAGRIEAAGAVPVLSSIIPYGWEVRNRTRLNGRAFALSEALRTHGVETGRTIADPFTRLFETPGIFDLYYDEDGYHPNPAGYDLLTEAYVAPVDRAIDAVGQIGVCVQELCEPDDDTLCLLGRRFAAEVSWTLDEVDEDGERIRGVGRGSTIGDTTGRFWFFDPENLELLVKVLDGRCLNGHVWVYFGALSNVEFELRVRDQATCVVKTYSNASGTFASRGDTVAFPLACPGS